MLAACALLAAPSGAPARGGRGHSSGAEPPSPSIGKVEPDSGPSTGGTLITITGFNLAPGANVKVGGVAATSVELVARGKLVAVTGPHPPGHVSVSVRNPDGREGTRGWSFRYVAGEPKR
jgi:IPT/TIG domain-containing protein